MSAGESHAKMSKVGYATPGYSGLVSTTSSDIDRTRRVIDQTWNHVFAKTRKKKVEKKK